jgi:hypothetical protein
MDCQHTLSHLILEVCLILYTTIEHLQFLFYFLPPCKFLELSKAAEKVYISLVSDLGKGES